MTRELLLQSIDEIFLTQREKPIIILCLYLEPSDVDLIRSELTPNEINPRSIGRFDGVAIYYPDQINHSEAALAEHAGIRYRYVQMDVVD